MEDRLLRIKEVLKYLKVGKTKFYSLTKKESLLAPIKIGSSSLWSYENIQLYILSVKK